MGGSIQAKRNGRTVLIGYTPRRSRPGLLAAMRKHGEQLVEFLRPGEHDSILLDGYPPYFVIGEWRHRILRPHPGPRQAGRRAAILSRRGAPCAMIIREADRHIARLRKRSLNAPAV
jgi:hypothetical protein